MLWRFPMHKQTKLIFPTLFCYCQTILKERSFLNHSQGAPAIDLLRQPADKNKDNPILICHEQQLRDIRSGIPRVE